jgi:hypothetical protein
MQSVFIDSYRNFDANRSDAFLVDLENVHVWWTSLSRILVKNFHGIDPDAATIECHGRQPYSLLINPVQNTRNSEGWQLLKHFCGPIIHALTRGGHYHHTAQIL